VLIHAIAFGGDRGHAGNLEMEGLSHMNVLMLSLALAGGVEPADPRLSFDVPREIRERYRNPDGSCVQCSIGMCGVDQHVPAAATLLWKTEYGPAERGGSGPDRVATYARTRGMKVHNVTGRAVYDYLKWATANGRGAAVTCQPYHMQTLAGHDPKSNQWFVCNNNSPQKIDTYDDGTFHRLCDASGPWCVVLDYPPHPARPAYRKWWQAPLEVNPDMTLDFHRKGELKPQLVQFNPRELPSPARPPEVNVKEVRRRGDCEQFVGDNITSNPLLDRFGECMARPANDADKWFIWCILDATGKRSERLRQAWRTNDELKAFATPGRPEESWAHYGEYMTEDASQSWRWEKLQISGTPTVICQPPRSNKYGDPSTVVFQAVYGDSPAELATALRQAILNYLATLPGKPRPDAITGPCPGPDCPSPYKPAPRPGPAPNDDGGGGERRPLSPLIPPPDTLRPASWFSSWLWPLQLIPYLVACLFVVVVIVATVLVLQWFLRRSGLGSAKRRSSRRK
jgi:hypothetical protein